MKFYAEKDLAFCGLACVLCSQEDCPGCKARGCKEGSDCSLYKCTTAKKLDGCYQCKEFPCDEKMLQGIRNKAFNRYAMEFGKQELLDCLRRNYEYGISYHQPNRLKGDYDLLETEDEIMQLIQFGKKNPYRECPVFETEHFILRLVSLDDAADLLDCYSDKNARPIFNSDNCTNDFFYDTMEEMRNCVKMWLRCFLGGEFIRFAVVDKSSNRAIGTIEMFGMVGKYKTSHGILRLDIQSSYEKKPYLQEILQLCKNEFFTLFAVEQIITKAVPYAQKRIAVLEKLGFEACSFSERPDYWKCDK